MRGRFLQFGVGSPATVSRREPDPVRPQHGALHSPSWHHTMQLQIRLRRSMLRPDGRIPNAKIDAFPEPTTRLAGPEPLLAPVIGQNKLRKVGRAPGVTRVLFTTSCWEWSNNTQRRALST